jgi:hypothetical protein
MAALTTSQEYAVVREAIQALSPSSTGAQAAVASFTVDGLTVTYQAGQLPWLQERERELARRLSVRNSRKRVTPDFSGTGSYLTL